MSKLIFDSKAEWDQAIENVGIQTADAGCVLSPGATPLVLADDFNDGVRAPEWKGHLTNSLIAQFDPFGSQSDEPLGVTGLRQKLAQSFTLPISIQLGEIQIKLQGFAINTFSPNLILEVQTDNADKPSGTVLASKTMSYASVAPLSGWTPFSFQDTLPTLPANQKLWIVFYTNPIGTDGEHIDMLYDLNQDLANQHLEFLNGTTQQWNTQFVATHDFYFRISRAIDLNPKPTEANGYLSFEYQNTSGTGEHIHMIRDVAQGDWEMEYRFRLRRLAPTFNSGQFILGILQGTRNIVDGAARDAKLIHEFRFNTQNNFNVSYEARMVDTTNTVRVSGSASWPNINFVGGFLANDNHIFNLKVTRVGTGLKYLFYHSDNPANILLETTVSPPVRTLSGDRYADIGPTSLFNTAFGVAFDLDYVKLNSPPVEFTTGYLRLRHSFGVNTTLANFEIKRQLPVAGDKLELQFRYGNTIQELDAAPFGAIVPTQPGSFDPGNPQDQYEKALLSLPTAKFFDTKISFTRASPSPNLQTYSLEFTVESTPAPPAVTETAKNILTYRRIIDSDNDWGRSVEKSSSIQIVNGMATLASVFQDLFDTFTIGPDWTVYQRNANLFSSFGFLRMNILSADSDAILVKTLPIPNSFTMTIKWKIDDLANMANGAFFNIFSIFNSASLPVPNDIRVGGLGTSTTHHTIIIRRAKGGDGSHRFGLVACRSDGVFVGWNQTTLTWVPGAGDQVIPAGKEATLWTFEVTVSAAGQLTIKAKDDQSVVRFDTSSQPLTIKINDNQRWLVLGDSDLSDMPSGTTQLYDSIETNIPTSGATSGYIRFRDSLGGRGQLGTIKVQPSTLIQTQPANIALKVRSADSLDDLPNVLFKETAPFVPSVFGNEIDLDIPPGAFIEVELDLFSGSAPEILNMSWEIEPLIDDIPLILSLDNITPETVVSSLATGTGQPENQSTVPNIKDGDPNTQWISTTGLEGFGVSWALNIGFKKGATAYQDTIDTIILRNTNFKKITITLSELNSNNPQTVFSGELLSSDAIIRSDPKLTANIIISIESTQMPNELKKLGEIYAGRLLVALPNFSRYEPKRELFETGNYRTLGGKIVAYRGKDKYSSRWTLTQVSKDLKDTLEGVFKANALVTFWPEPKFRTRDLFDVTWKVEAIPFPYTDIFKNAGYSVDAEMIE